MTKSYDCPNCGANVHDDGESDIVSCRFCGTDVTIPRMRRPFSRRELELERDQLRARDAEWTTRIQQAGKRGPADFLSPPIGCCGLYFALFVIGSLTLSAMGFKESTPHMRAVAAIAICAAIIGSLAIAWRREAQRKNRIASLEEERNADRHLREKRLREVEGRLESLDD